MTPLEITLIATLWIVLGLFICNKVNWFKDYGGTPECVATVIFAPLVFIWDFINRFFIQKWH